VKIRYYGHVGQATGYGRAASDLCLAFLRAGVDLEIRPLAPPGPQLWGSHMPLGARLRSDGDLSPNPDVIIVHTLPLDCVRALEVIDVKPRRHGGGGPAVIVQTTWEALNAPHDLIEALGSACDEVWVPSGANDLAFATLEPKLARVRIVPHGFDEDSFDARRQVVESTGPFRFYYVGAWTARKNPAGLVRAFAYAFAGRSDVELVLQCAGARPEAINGVAASTALRALDLVGVRPALTHKTDAEILALHRSADCFVTATRGEAWNLPAFDAMLAGRHVISPRGMGSDDFLRHTTADLYGGRNPGIAHGDVELRTVGTMGEFRLIGAQGLTSRCLWLEPDLVELALAMREAAALRRRDLRVDFDPRERYGYGAVAKLALNHIENLP